MADNIIHIGYHKTATNWFQRIFYPQVTSHQYLHRKRARAAFLGASALRFPGRMPWLPWGSEKSPGGSSFAKRN